jgi:hypothetical protein
MGVDYASVVSMSMSTDATSEARATCRAIAVIAPAAKPYLPRLRMTWFLTFESLALAVFMAHP